jgi:hypothetical protein
MKAIVMNSAGGYDTLEYVERPPSGGGSRSGIGRGCRCRRQLLGYRRAEGPTRRSYSASSATTPNKRIGSWPNESIDVPFSVSAPR